MAKYCKICYKEKVNPNIKDEDLSFTEDVAVCEGCGEVKHLVIDQQIDQTVMSEAECNVETQKHIEQVRKYIRFIPDKLTSRGVEHDASKMLPPEVELFAQHTKKLANLEYGSEEYKASLEALKPALDHHYSCSRHHPEHFPNGVNDMTLVDILEMFCDWKASTHRMNDGNLLKSIEQNAERFGIEGQLKQILINTAKSMDEQC